MFRAFVIGWRGLAIPAALALAICGCASTGTIEGDDTVLPDGFETKAGAAGYHMLLAEMALQKELYDVAVEEYLKAARLSDSPDVAKQATQVAFDLGRDADALVAAERWQQLDQDDILPHRYLARLYVRAQNVDGAARSLQALLEKSEQSEDDSFLELSSLLLQESDSATALASMAKLVARHEKVARAQYSLGVMALRAGELDLAKRSAKKAAELSPDWGHANLLYARALIASGKVEEGINYAGERVGGQNSASERLEYGILLAAVDRDAEARIVLEQVIFDDRSNAGALRALGLLDLKEGDLDGAQSYFTQLLATGRSTYDAFFYLASIAESKQQYRRAIRIYGQVVEGPNAVAAQLRVGGLLADAGEIDASLQHMERFAAAQPRYVVDMALGQGEVLISDGQIERALTLYDDVLAQYPEETRVQYARAFLLEDMDRVSEALHQLRLILAKNPNDANALNALGYTLADRTDQVDEAFELIERAHQLQPDSAAIIDSLGWVQFKRGNFAEAQALLEQAYAMFPDAEIVSHLVEVLWHRGDQAAAGSLLQEALQSMPYNDKLHDVKARLGL